MPFLNDDFIYYKEKSYINPSEKVIGDYIQ